MTPHYHVLDSVSGQKILVSFRPATEVDFAITARDGWQSNWLSGFTKAADLVCYALECIDTYELIGLGAYRMDRRNEIVHVEYIESAAHSNPTLTSAPKYLRLGAVFLAYGIQCSIDSGFGGAIFLKAKTSDLLRHYIQTYGAVPFSHIHPELLLIEGEASKKLFFQFLEED